VTALGIQSEPPRITPGLSVMSAIRKPAAILCVITETAQCALMLPEMSRSAEQTPSGRSCGVETENATAFLQWRSWLRGADLNRRPLGYAI
jgi:hypothetical protein